MNEEAENEIKRKLGMLEHHIINLIVPIQGIHEMFSNQEIMKQLLHALKNPIQVDDRNFKRHVQDFNAGIGRFQDSLERVNISQTYDEIKFIGKRLHKIEQTLLEMKHEGVRRKIVLEVNVDGIETKGKAAEDFLGAIDEVVPDGDEALKALLKTLFKREQEVLIHRLGLLGTKKNTLKGIGEMIQLSKERVRQVEAKALRKCRHPSRKNLVDRIQHKELKDLITG